MLVFAVVKSLKELDGLIVEYSSSYCVGMVASDLVEREDRSTTPKAVVGGAKDCALDADLRNGRRAHNAGFDRHISTVLGVSYKSKCTYNVLPWKTEGSLPFCRRVSEMATISACSVAYEINFANEIRTFPVALVWLWPRAIIWSSFTKTHPMGTSFSSKAARA